MFIKYIIIQNYLLLFIKLFIIIHKNIFYLKIFIKYIIIQNYLLLFIKYILSKNVYKIYYYQKLFIIIHKIYFS
jgi:hypothetical protein